MPTDTSRDQHIVASASEAHTRHAHLEPDSADKTPARDLRRYLAASAWAFGMVIRERERRLRMTIRWEQTHTLVQGTPPREARVLREGRSPYVR